jgi:hypothetical protein
VFQVVDNHGVPVDDVGGTNSDDLSRFPHRVLVIIIFVKPGIL